MTPAMGAPQLPKSQPRHQQQRRGSSAALETPMRRQGRGTRGPEGAPRPSSAAGIRVQRRLCSWAPPPPPPLPPPGHKISKLGDAQQLDARVAGRRGALVRRVVAPVHEVERPHSRRLGCSDDLWGARTQARARAAGSSAASCALRKGIYLNACIHTTARQTLTSAPVPWCPGLERRQLAPSPALRTCPPQIRAHAPRGAAPRAAPAPWPSAPRTRSCCGCGRRGSRCPPCHAAACG